MEICSLDSQTRLIYEDSFISYIEPCSSQFCFSFRLENFRSSPLPQFALEGSSDGKEINNDHAFKAILKTKKCVIIMQNRLF